MGAAASRQSAAILKIHVTGFVDGQPKTSDVQKLFLLLGEKVRLRAGV
jgi:hypothetical protein